MMKEKIYSYLLLLGDNSLILGHRLSELCGHGPTLETDIALTNISLDLFGQVRNYFQYASALKEGEATEDSLAFLRLPHEYKNCLLVEQPNINFAHIITRQFLFDAFHLPLLGHLSHSNDEQLAAIAQKSLKEVKYHIRFSASWMKRLGDGTELSHQKMQDALDILWPYTGELFEETPVEAEMREFGIGVPIGKIEEVFLKEVQEVVLQANLSLPDSPKVRGGGKMGLHSEHLGYILSDMQYMQRAYPQMTW